MIACASKCVCLLVCFICLAQIQQVNSSVPANPTVVEDFEAPENLSNWLLVDSAAVMAEGSGKALVLNGRGYAEWPKVQAKDFTLKFRYRHAEGTGDVVLQSNGEPPDHKEYHIKFIRSGALVTRREARVVKELGRGDIGLQPGKWHHMTICVRDGEIRITSDKTGELIVNDPQPLPAGLICLGCIEGSGFAYDDVVFSPGKASPNGVAVGKIVDPKILERTDQPTGGKPEPPAVTPIQLPKTVDDLPEGGTKPGPPAVTPIQLPKTVDDLPEGGKKTRATSGNFCPTS